MKPFLDTNIVVYAAEPGDGLRNLQARSLIARFAPGELTVSTQVLAETYNVLVKKRRVLHRDALAVVQVLRGMRVWVPGADAVQRALELAGDHTLPTWDAMLLQAAMDAGCDTFFSEDLQAGRRFGALEIVNPFDLAAHEGAAPPPATRRPVARKRATRR